MAPSAAEAVTDTRARAGAGVAIPEIEGIAAGVTIEIEIDIVREIGTSAAAAAVATETVPYCSSHCPVLPHAYLLSQAHYMPALHALSASRSAPTAAQLVMCVTCACL